MRTIFTTGRKVVPVLVDDDDYPRLSVYSWYLDKRGYAFRIEQFGERRKNIRMHRDILKTTQLVDHKDTNKLNNQKTNLRPSSKRQNAHNTRVKRSYGGKKKSSQYKGVSKRRGAWRMSIKLPDGSVIDKRFETELEAALAYDYLARQHFGEFARTNFTPEKDLQNEIQSNSM